MLLVDVDHEVIPSRCAEAEVEVFEVRDEVGELHPKAAVVTGLEVELLGDLSVRHVSAGCMRIWQRIGIGAPPTLGSATWTPSILQPKPRAKTCARVRAHLHTHAFTHIWVLLPFCALVAPRALPLERAPGIAQLHQLDLVHLLCTDDAVRVALWGERGSMNVV